MKNKTTFLILLVLIGLIFAAPACKKYTGPRTLTAQAVDKTTMQPVPDTWLYLLRTEKGDVFSFSAQNYEIVEAKLSDAEGKVEFTFDYQDDYTYDFYAINENGYSEIQGLGIDTIICCLSKNGNAQSNIVWWIYEDEYYNGDKFIKEVFIPAHDTTLVKIEY